MGDPLSAGGVTIPGLSEGIIFPEKQEGTLEACVYRDKSKVKELLSEVRVYKEPVLVRVLVGSKEGIEKWLRVSGPASCGLWIEVSDDGELVVSQVKVAYRLRSSSGGYLSIQAGSLVALLAQTKVEQEKLKKNGDGNNSLSWRWLAVMPSKAFRQLLCMIEPGGVLAEFQIVLRQLVDSSNYLEVGFRHLDVSGWLSRYPFILTFEGVDVLVLTRDLRWTLLRFDCLDGKLKVSRGSALAEENAGGGTDGSFQVDDWQLWEEISMEKDARRIGTLGAIVFNNFYVDGKGFTGGVAVQEFLDCLVNSWKEAGKKLRYMLCVSGATVFEMKSVDMFPSVRLSAEEQMALNKLQSEVVSERRQGLDVLIELLLGGMSDTVGEAATAGRGSASSRGLVPSAREMAINWNTFHDAGSEGHSVSSKSSGSFSAQNAGWLRLLEWIDRAFFYRLLLEEALVVAASDGRGLRRIVEAVLKVIDIIPGDASCRISDFFSFELKRLVGTVVGAVDVDRKRKNEDEIISRPTDQVGPEARQQVEASKKLVCIANMLSQIVHESTIAAGVIADSGIVTALEAFLDLVHMQGSATSSVLPGEVLEDKPSSLRPVGFEAFPTEDCGCVELGVSTLAVDRINRILQAQRKEYLKYDQAGIRRSMHSTGFSKVLLKLLLRRVGAVSTVKCVSLEPDVSVNVDSARTRLKTARTKKLLCQRSQVQSSALLANAAATKCHLLSATACMLTIKSSSLTRTKQELVQKLNEQQRLQLVDSFVEEMVHSACDGFLEKAHEHIFQILYMLDRTETGLRRTAQGTKFPVVLLTKVQTRIKATLLEHTARMKAEHNVEAAWDALVTVGSLLQILSTFACKWPEEGAAFLVFQHCGDELEAVFRVLSSSQGPATWGGGELLVMQNVLRLFATTMQNSDGKRQTELDNILWKILIDNNWTFIRSYSCWVVSEACPDCIWDLLEESFWSLWEPLELTEPLVDGGDVFSGWLPKWLPSMQCEEIPSINLVSFLRLSVGLIQRKLDRDKELLLPGKARMLLEFLMHPVTGLLMKLLKGDGFNKKKMIPQKEYAAAYFHVKHVGEDIRSLMPFCTQRQRLCSFRHQPYPPPEERAASLSRRPGDVNEKLLDNSAAESTSFNLSCLAATNLEIASLQLLASIFSLSFQMKSSPAANPFLSKGYTYPFLDFHFLRLRHLYYVNLLRRCKVRLGEPQLGKVSENSCTLEDDSPPSETEVRDEQLSLECAVHVQVLLALAQNQTEDVTSRFKQLRVMDFLVHQIALEYEASQVATPRDVVRINKALAAQLRNSAGSFRAKNAGEFEPPSESSVVSTPSLAGLKRGLGTFINSPGDLESSKRLCSGHKKALETNFRILSRDVPKLELGFLSARNMGSQDQASCESYLLSRPFTGRSEFLLKWQEVMRPALSKRQSENKQLTPAEDKAAVDESSLAEDNAMTGILEDEADDVNTKEKPVYTGKFFDLNEEVERELAEEDDESEKGSSDEDSVTESDGSTTMGNERLDGNADADFRPFVPKLNLPRSARKGDEAATSGAESKLDQGRVDNKSPGVSLSITSTASCKRVDVTTPYELERSQRRLYRNPSLHLFLLELYITLMLTSQGTLDERYSDRFQTEKQKLNAPFFLFYHLNHAANSYLLPCLAEKLKSYHLSAFRILKLSWKGLFDPSLYKNRIRIAHGAFAQIYKATINSEKGPKLVVLKTIDLPKGPYEPCKFFDVYSEVQILEVFVGEPRVCQLLDYGVESESFVLVLKHYKCSLRAWRLNQGAFFESSASKGLHLQKSQKSFFDRLPLYLEVYAAVLEAVKVLEKNNVVHYDLKCDNVLLEPVDSDVPEEEFWDPPWPPPDKRSYRLPFKVCLTDFGQSKTSIFQGGECTFRNRGTEYVKSPEMLKLLRTGSDVDGHRGDGGVGKAVDVWGLGCLLYELLAAEYLLYDEDWMRFFIRVTTSSEEIIPTEKAERIGNYGPVLEFIRFVLVRDPDRRPTLDEVITHLKRLQVSLDQSTATRTGTWLSEPATDGAHVEPPPAETESSKPSKRGLVPWLCCGCWKRSVD